MIALRTFARHLGVSLAAVQKAIADGRLAASVTADARGARKLTSIAEAETEWNANTRPPAPTDDPAYRAGRVAHQSAETRRAAARAEEAELDLAERRGELIRAADVEAALTEEYSVVRTKLLGLSTRVKQRRPDLDASTVKLIDDLVREALEALADTSGVAS